MRRILSLVVGFVLVVASVGLAVGPISALEEVTETSRVSVASDGTQANDGSIYPAVSADGSTIVYTSDASNLVESDTNGTYDMFMFDVATGDDRTPIGLLHPGYPSV